MANTRQAIKRVRQALRRRVVNRRTRSTAKSLVQRATRVVLGQNEGDAESAITNAVRALDKAAAKGIIHPNNAARRKSRLMAKANAALVTTDAAPATQAAGAAGRKGGSKTATRQKVAAARASKAATGAAADRPRTAAGKAKVAVTRASRESRTGTSRGPGGSGGSNTGT